MTQKVNGFAAGDAQFLTGALKMFTVTVANYDLTVKDGGPAGAQTHNLGLEKIIEAISLRAQPVVLGVVGATGFRFAVEHNDVFMDPAAPSANLSTALTTFSTYVQGLVRAASGDADVTVSIASFAF